MNPADFAPWLGWLAFGLSVLKLAGDWQRRQAGDSAQVRIAELRSHDNLLQIVRAEVNADNNARMHDLAGQINGLVLARQEDRDEIEGLRDGIADCQTKHEACEQRCVVLSGQVESLEASHELSTRHIGQLKDAIVAAGVAMPPLWRPGDPERRKLQEVPRP